MKAVIEEWLTCYETQEESHIGEDNWAGCWQVRTQVLLKQPRHCANTKKENGQGLLEENAIEDVDFLD